jgi:uncharacterized membrane protein
MGSSAADLAMMRQLVKDLQEELKAISTAEDALGKYIREKT